MDAESQREEVEMETANQDEKEETIKAEKTGKRKFWGAFYNFLAMGGFLVILVAIVAIVVFVSILLK